MNEEADQTALVGPVDGKFCFKKQTDGMVGSVVVGCAGAPRIEAAVLAAVGPSSNPASDAFYCVSFPLSLLSVSFYLSCPLKGIKNVCFFTNEHGWLSTTLKKKPNVLLLKLMY